MLKELAKNKETYKDFLKYLFYVAFKKNKKSYNMFPSFSEEQHIFYLISYLEYKQVPVLEAINYYSYKYNVDFKYKVKYCIIKEFYRIENNLKCSYIPF